MIKSVIFLKVSYFNCMLLCPLVVDIMSKASVKPYLSAVVDVTSNGKLAGLKLKVDAFKIRT